MKRMSRQEKELAERHLYLVRDTVLGAMSLNESIQGFGYDDLYQTGCEALCHAAQKYRAEGGASFPTFASVVIRNRLLSYCRKVARVQRPLEYMDAPQPSGSGLAYADAIPDDGFHGISDADTFLLLSQAQERCSGTTRKGIEALAMKCRGHTGVEIAARYGVRPNHVAAWISRATKMLREERLTA
ncbi:sigma-70 family RNA polymerase sigma factor [uncultured Acetatifactor sp.]|uniref:sigma-70 family RNA polymerase sigma factor n=1 Tax=uncultured Acetatifactor sp. TaxID=1671927 RepID=UPI002611EB14|nr:sigma-70 family RNA polymerase sigma factor [uncultured Acetatifactor sp.]